MPVLSYRDVAHEFVDVGRRLQAIERYIDMLSATEVYGVIMAAQHLEAARYEARALARALDRICWQVNESLPGPAEVVAAVFKSTGNPK